MTVHYAVQPKHRYVVALSVPPEYKPFATKDLIAGRAKEFIGDVDDLAVFTGDEYPKGEIVDVKPEQIAKFEGETADYVVRFREKAGGNGPRDVSFDPKFIAWIVDLGDPEQTGAPTHPPSSGDDKSFGKLGSLKNLRRAACQAAGGVWNDEGDGHCVDPSDVKDKPMPSGLVEPKGEEGAGAWSTLALLLGGGLLVYLMLRRRS